MLTFLMLAAVYTAGVATPWAWARWGDAVRRRLLWWLPGPQ